MQPKNKRSWTNPSQKSENTSKTKRVKIDDRSYAFLETINPRKLDFDFDKICSVTLSHLNVYCCLVCGKYFQGRQENTPAFLHSLNENHHVFINFNSLKVYLLPGGIEVDDHGKIQLLQTVRYAISPVFTKEEIWDFPKQCFDLRNRMYVNGFIGLNNTSGSGCVNVILLAIAHMTPIRDYFLLQDTNKEDELVKRLAIIIRKVWSVRLFKQHVSTDEFFAYVSVNYKGVVNQSQDPRTFLLWLINTLVKKSKLLDSILSKNCQGKLQMTTIPFREVYDENENLKEFHREDQKQKKIVAPFWSLSLNLPPRPLFKDGINANDLPQVTLGELLTKFNGVKEQEMLHCVKKYSLTHLPQYLMLHFDRFEKGAQQPVKNRNQTLVEFPLAMELKNTRYELLANIVHEPSKQAATNTEIGEDERSHWKIQLHNSKTDQWIELDGNTIRTREKELLFLNETYIQIWEMKIS